MPGKPFLYNDPQFSEYVFLCMVSATQSQRNDLNIDELKHFKNVKSIRRFAENDSLERKVLMLSRLNIQLMIITSPVENLSIVDELLQESKHQFKKQSRAEVIKKMFDKQIFFTGSRDVMLSCQMLVMNSHAQAYQPDYTYPKLQQAMAEANLNTIQDSFKDGIKAFDMLSKVFLAMEANNDDTETICGVSLYELKILMALLPNRNTYMTANAIALRIHENVRQQLKKQGVTRVANKLAGQEYIFVKEDRIGVKKIFSYTIAGKGIDTVGKYIRYVLNEAK